jgi:arylsulfatase A-like enzyme
MKTTFVERLHENGYYAGVVGKYLNSWDGSRRPEFDFWVVFAGHGEAMQYTDPSLNVQGVWRDHSGYITNILGDYALEFLRQATQQDKPFALLFTPNAPHEPATPAPGDETLYPDLPPHRPPSFNEDVSDKPAWVQQHSPLDIGKIDKLRRRQLQTLHTLDQAVKKLIDWLNEQDKLDNTMIIYLSDNGYMWGEHGLDGKTFSYEESIRVPFAIRYPPLVSKPHLENRLAANIDIAPTVYDLAGIPIPPDVDGRSLLPLLRGEAAWREDLLIEGWPERKLDAHYSAIHTDRYVYVETVQERPELYDLASDPYQMQNQADNPAYATILTNLKKRLEQVRGPQIKRTWVTQCTAPIAPLTPEQITEGLGDGLRLAYYDCAQSWLYPADGQSAGWVIVSLNAPGWAMRRLKAARLSFEQWVPEISPPFRIYESENVARWPQGGLVRVAPSPLPLAEVAGTPTVSLPLSFEGGLTLLGYTVDRTELAAGEMVQLETAWRVDNQPGQLLSLMANIVGPEEQLATTGDGLGVPIESWQVGDVFVQRHKLIVPDNTPAGLYWVQTGVYWLDGTKRWPVKNDLVTGDRVLLVPIQVKRP